MIARFVSTHGPEGRPITPMKKTALQTLSPLAVLMAMAAPASAAILCNPTATRDGDTLSLRGNCVDDQNDFMPVAAGSEVWHLDSGGTTQPIGQRALPNGSLVVPSLPGEHTYYISAIDTGYGGLINLQDEGGYPRVTVSNTCTGEPEGPALASARRTQALRRRPASHDCPVPIEGQVRQQLSAPLQTLQVNRVRGHLENAQARMRLLRAGRLAALDVQGVPLPQRQGEAAAPQRAGVYVLGLGDYLRQNRSSTQSEFTLRTTALSVGADYRLNDAWAFGGNVGASRSELGFADSLSRQAGRGSQGTAYASWSFTPESYLNATVSYEATRFELTRDDDTGDLSYSSPKGSGVGLSLSAGRDFVLGAWSIGPYLRWDHIRSTVEAFEETGGATALAIGRQRVTSSTVNLGTQAQLSVPVSWGIVLPYARVEYTHRVDKTAQSPTATLLNDGTTLLLPTAADTRADHGHVALGLTGVNQQGVSWFADFQTGVALKGYRSRRLSLGMRVEL